jgi:hypothetical protein
VSALKQPPYRAPVNFTRPPSAPQPFKAKPYVSYGDPAKPSAAEIRKIAIAEVTHRMRNPGAYKLDKAGRAALAENFDAFVAAQIAVVSNRYPSRARA